MNPSRVVRVVMVSLALNFGTGDLAAQAPSASELDSVPLDQVPGRLAAMDDEWSRQVDEFKKILTQEEAAKRVSESVVQSLRWSLRHATSANYDSKSLIGSARVPLDNEALRNGFQNLEAAQTSYQAKRGELVDGVLKTIREGISKLTLQCNNPAEIDGFIASIVKVREALQKRPASSGADSYAFTSAESYLTALKRLIEAQANADAQGVSMAMNSLRSSYGEKELFSEADKTKRIDQASLPFQASADEAEKRLAAGLESRKPEAELMLALARFDEAYEKLRLVRSFDQRVLIDPVQGYRALVNVLKAAEQGDVNTAKARIDMARGSFRDAGKERMEKFEQLLSEWERDFKDDAMKRSKTDAETLRKQLASVKNVADLDALVSQLQSPDMARRSGNGEGAAQVVAALSVISNAWRTNSLALLQHDGFARSGTAIPEVAALKSRVEREVFTRAVRAPELGEPPLAEKPFLEAIETLCDQLAGKREWRRLYQILEARASIATIEVRAGVPRTPDDTLPALRAYISGQNLELAALWSEAVDSYRAVLRSVSPRAPINDAAERIKVISKEHPEAVRPAAAPDSKAQSGAPPR